jgi:hypothetical protein
MAALKTAEQQVLAALASGHPATQGAFYPETPDVAAAIRTASTATETPPKQG